MHTEPLQASMKLGFTSPCSGLDRSISGRTQVTLASSYYVPGKLRTVAFAADTFYLSLPLRHTPRPVIRNVRYDKRRILLSPLGFRIFLHPGKGTFQLSFTVLVSYRFQNYV